MPVLGVTANAMFNNYPGVIGGASPKTFSVTQTFNPAKNILALPVLQYVGETDDESTTWTFISEFMDGGVTKTGKFIGVAAQSCSKIVWSLYCANSINNPVRLIFFFD